MSIKSDCQRTSTTQKESLSFLTKPADFAPAVEVAAVYVNVKGKILLLQNSSHKKEAGAWGVPAGKIDLGESTLQGARRELFEETGIEISHDGALIPIGQLYFRKPNIDYVYHAFGLKLDNFPDVTISEEHQNYKCVTQKEALKLNLMDGALAALDFYFNSENIKHHDS